jgi:hypothetical protein
LELIICDAPAVLAAFGSTRHTSPRGIDREQEKLREVGHRDVDSVGHVPQVLPSSIARATPTAHDDADGLGEHRLITLVSHGWLRRFAGWLLIRRANTRV